jgi:hypothetical protein
MAGSITVSSITLDSDNTFSIRSNTGATILSANGTGLITGIANSAVTSSMIASVSNTAISGVITGTQLAVNSVNSTIIAANTISNTNFQTGAIENYMMASGGSLGARNKIINGSMIIAQRGTALTGMGQDTYGACDRWKHWAADGGESGRCTMSQSTDVPTNQGFRFSEKLQVTTAQASVSAAHGYKYVQRIESTNCFDLGFGSTGKYITITFWAKVENKPGTYCVSMWLYGASSNKVIVREVSLTTSWAKYTITVPTDSTQQVVNNTSTGIELGIGLMAGSNIRNGNAASDWVAGATASTYTSNQVNFYDSTSNALYVTGVQLEAGAVPTPFEHRQYGQELVLCQRYYEIIKKDTNETLIGVGFGYAGEYAFVNYPFKATKRSEPTADYNGSSSNLQCLNGGGTWNQSGGGISFGTNTKTMRINCPIGGISNNGACEMRIEGSSYINISAEL